ncbi:MAG: hypothetical protein IJU95_00070 [Treponema sp.]|nr:hypothetical protein [Treponema sp.]
MLGLAYFTVPCLLSVFLFSKDLAGKSYKTFCAKTLLTAIPALILTWLAWVILQQYYCYEYFSIYSVLCAFFSTLLIPFLLDRKSFSYRNVLNFLLLYSASVVFYSIMTHGQAVIHSDTATATILARSQLESKRLFPDNWYYANGDVWFLERNLLMIPFLRIIKNQSLLRALDSAAWVALACIGLYLLSSRALKDSSYKLMVPFTLLFFTGARGFILYEAAYIGQLTWLCLTLLLAVRAYDRQAHLKTIIPPPISTLSVFIVLLTMAGSRCLAEINLPLCLTLIVRELVHIGFHNEPSERSKNSCLITGALLLSTVLGLAAYHWICATHNVSNTDSNALIFTANWWSNFQQYFINRMINFGMSSGAELTSAEGLRNFVSVFFMLLTCFVIPILQIRRIRQENESVIFISLFAFIHNAIMFLVIVFLGKTESRYVLTSIYMELIVSSRYIYAHWIKGCKASIIRNILVAIVASGVCINSLYLIDLSTGYYPALLEQKEFCAKLLATGAHKGYASFWNAYKNEVYSDLAIRFGAIYFERDRIEPNLCLVDSTVFDFTSNEPTFLLLSDDQLHYVQKDSFKEEYGAPKQILPLGGLTAYIYDYDIGRNFRKTGMISRLFLQEPSDKGLFIPTTELCLGTDTKLTEDGYPISSGKQLLTYGPYVSASPGSYEIKVLYEFIGNDSGDYPAYILVTANSGKKEYKEQQITAPQEGECTFTVDIPAYSKNVEIVCKSKTAGFILKGYEVRRLAE